MVIIGVGDRVLYRAAFGQKSVEPSPSPMEPDNVFDIASLTKVVATTTAIMQLVQAGRIDLDAPVATYWPDFAANGKTGVTVRQLLMHTSGLLPDVDAATQVRDAPGILAAIAGAHPVTPPGAAFTYSDENFIVLGALIGRLSGEPLDVYARGHIFAPIKMADTAFNPPDAWHDRIVPTSVDHGKRLWGVVEDPTAAHMGGVAGHAGVFSTANDLARFARMLLRGGALDGVRLLRPETVALITRPVDLPGGVRRTLGWDVSSHFSMGMDQAFGATSFGHTGYTGCLLWIDPGTQGYLIVLTNRLHPDGHGDARPLREDLGPLAAALIRASLAPAVAPGPGAGLPSPNPRLSLSDLDREPGQGRAARRRCSAASRPACTGRW